MLLLLGAVVCVASVPPIDDPDTAVDESDFQLTLASPSLLSTKLVQPIANVVDLPKLASCGNELRGDLSRHEFMPQPKRSGSHSSQILLCTFLI